MENIYNMLSIEEIQKRLTEITKEKNKLKEQLQKKAIVTGKNTIMIADSNEKNRRELREYIAKQSSQNLIVIGTADNGNSCIEKLQQIQPDILIINNNLSDTDGLNILESIKNKHIPIKIKILTSVIISPLITQMAYDCNVDYIINQINNYPLIIKRINDIIKIKEPTQIIYKEHIDEYDVGDFLINMGISPKKKGYTYLKDVILLVLDNGNIIHALTKHVYLKIAEKYNATSVSVERAIRTAIEDVTNNSNTLLFKEVFGNSMNEIKVTNKDFITNTIEYLRKKCF